MARWLKTGIAEDEKRARDDQVRDTVTKILDDIERRGDEAVRELSIRFDNWDPADFRLSDDQIAAALEEIPDETLDDVRFAQAQIRNFAQIQRDSLQDVEAETLPGVILGHKNIPVGSVGCYVPGGKYPLVASAHMSVVTAKVGRRGAHRDLRPAVRWPSRLGHHRRTAPRRGR